MPAMVAKMLRRPVGGRNGRALGATDPRAWPDLAALTLKPPLGMLSESGSSVLTLPGWAKVAIRHWSSRRRSDGERTALATENVRCV